LEDPGIDGRILRWIVSWWDGVWGMDWIDLAQDRDRWRALVNAVMNFTFAPCMLLHLLYLKPAHALILKHTFISTFIKNTKTC
jgi:hypothetical protein